MLRSEISTNEFVYFIRNKHASRMHTEQQESTRERKERNNGITEDDMSMREEEMAQ